MQGERFGNPFIFKKIISYLGSGVVEEDTSESELLDTMIRHINLEVEEKGEYTGVREMRKHLSYYTKGLQNSSVIREKINRIESRQELVDTLTEYFDSFSNI